VSTKPGQVQYPTRSPRRGATGPASPARSCSGVL
jgi:hypothetical protein